jgi:hypothetical protein
VKSFSDHTDRVVDQVFVAKHHVVSRTVRRSAESIDIHNTRKSHAIWAVHQIFMEDRGNGCVAFKAGTRHCSPF